MSRTAMLGAAKTKSKSYEKSLKCHCYHLNDSSVSVLTLLKAPFCTALQEQERHYARRAVANRTDATFIRVIGSELVQKYVGEGARMVRELFEMARTKKACIIFFDEIDAIGGARFDDGAGGDNEVQRTMLELITQLDGFDSRGNIKVMFATNRPSTLDPALMRPGRIDRKIEFSLPDLDGRANILRIHAKSMSVERDIRWELISRLCPNATGAELRSVATEAGMFAIRARRKVATEKDFLAAVEKVIKSNLKFNSTAAYAQYN